MWSKDLLNDLTAAIQKIPEGLSQILSQHPAHEAMHGSGGRGLLPGPGGLDESVIRNLSGVSRSIDLLIPDLSRLTASMREMRREYATSMRGREHTLPGVQKPEIEIPSLSPAEFAREYVRHAKVDTSRLADAIKPTPFERTRPTRADIPKGPNVGQPPKEIPAGSPYAGMEPSERPVEIETPKGIKAVARGPAKPEETEPAYLSRTEKEVLASELSREGVSPARAAKETLADRMRTEQGRKAADEWQRAFSGQEPEAATPFIADPRGRVELSETVPMKPGETIGDWHKRIEEIAFGPKPEPEPFGGTIGITSDAAKVFERELNAARRAGRGPDQPVPPDMPGLKTGLSREGVERARAMASRSRFGSFFPGAERDFVRTAAWLGENPVIGATAGYYGGSHIGRNIGRFVGGKPGAVVGEVVGGIQGAAALAGQFGVLAAGAGLAAKALTQIPEAAREFAEHRVAASAVYAPFNSEIALATARYGIRGLQRDIRSAQELAPSAAAAMDAASGLKDKLEPHAVFWNKLWNRVSQGASAVGGGMAELTAPYAEIGSELLDGNLKDGFKNTLEKESIRSHRQVEEAKSWLTQMIEWGGVVKPPTPLMPYGISSRRKTSEPAAEESVEPPTKKMFEHTQRTFPMRPPMQIP